jgi:hypothetical protein
MPKFTITHYGLQKDGVTKETVVEAETEMLACALALTEFRNAGAVIDEHDPVDASEGGSAPSQSRVSEVKDWARSPAGRKFVDVPGLDWLLV